MYILYSLPNLILRSQHLTLISNASCNNVALPYFTIGYLPSPRNIKILKIGDGYVIAANLMLDVDLCVKPFPTIL